MLYDNLEPFGSPSDDQRAGTIAAVTLNVHRDPKKRREPFGPADFFPRLAAPEVVKPRLLPSRDELALKMRAVFGAPGKGKRYVPKKPS